MSRAVAGSDAGDSSSRRTSVSQTPYHRLHYSSAPRVNVGDLSLTTASGQVSVALYCTGPSCLHTLLVQLRLPRQPSSPRRQNEYQSKNWESGGRLWMWLSDFESERPTRHHIIGHLKDDFYRYTVHYRVKQKFVFLCKLQWIAMCAFH